MNKFILCISAVFIVSCGKSDSNEINAVKNSMLPINPDITIGKALDGWVSCDETRWQSFLNKNKITVIEFRCMHKISNYLSEIQRFALPEQIDAGGLKLMSIADVFRFKMNPKNQFDLSFAKTTYIWSDETILKKQRNLAMALTDAYNNVLMFDSSTITRSVAQKQIKLFTRMKTMGTHPDKAIQP